jgi:hypothetical protein
MPVLREAAIAMVVLFAFLFASEALFGTGEARFDDAFYDGAFYAPRSEEFRFASDATPATRVDGVFALFVPREGRNGKSARL